MQGNALLELAAKAADEKKAEQLVALDMRGISLIADYFLIGHGNSHKQVQSIAREIKNKAQEEGQDVKRLEGFDEAKWVLIDLGDIIVHIFHKDERHYYNLEKLWGDASQVELEAVLS
ncbi:ribosome-associated protein [Alteribacillus persepolensis]|uniref:Ribosomal silencing factor RsfS n=1 Tax=Alteribacillus persepolensis TaxID=568899 RepID=A0A1G8CMM0_9BACI|nr:ribosome silencing factor [Alteribacillus persepolensis]SDH46807.1 ribosome-associated protein [Alteribacillus persepolensis]